MDTKFIDLGIHVPDLVTESGYRYLDFPLGYLGFLAAQPVKLDLKVKQAERRKVVYRVFLETAHQVHHQPAAGTYLDNVRRVPAGFYDPLPGGFKPCSIIIPGNSLKRFDQLRFADFPQVHILDQIGLHIYPESPFYPYLFYLRFLLRRGKPSCQE